MPISSMPSHDHGLKWNPSLTGIRPGRYFCLLSIWLSVCLSACPSVCLFACLSYRLMAGYSLFSGGTRDTRILDSGLDPSLDIGLSNGFLYRFIAIGITLWLATVLSSNSILRMEVELKQQCITS